MGISLRKNNGFVVVDIHSFEPNTRMVNLLRKILTDLIAHERVDILVNMTNVKSIDSSALGTLILFQKKCRQNRGEIRIFGIQTDILMIFHLVHIDKYIKLFNSENDAINNENIFIKRRFKVYSR